MADVWDGFNAVLAARGVDPRSTKLYRHTMHPLFGPLAFERWHEGHARFLSFATTHLKQAGVFTERVKWCAHFLKEDLVGLEHGARFLGVTRVIGPTRPFDEHSPVAGYLPGEAMPEQPGESRVATPLAWEDWALWDGLTEKVCIEWGTGPRAKAQWAHTYGRKVFADPNESASIETPEAMQELIEGDEGLKTDQDGSLVAAYDKRVLRWHLRYERRGTASRLAKEMKPLVCECCGLDGVSTFGQQLAKRCMEAHHLTPVSMMVSEERLVDPVADFAILCATCHRLIHGMERPDDLLGVMALWKQKS